MILFSILIEHQNMREILQSHNYSIPLRIVHFEAWVSIVVVWLVDPGSQMLRVVNDPNHSVKTAKLWKNTEFCIWSTKAADEIESLKYNVKKLSQIFGHFQKKMELHFQAISMDNSRLFIGLFEQLSITKQSIHNFFGRRMKDISMIIEQIAEYKTDLETGILQANKQYNRKIRQFLSCSNKYFMRSKKIESIQLQFLRYSHQRKEMIENCRDTHPFQIWYAGYSLRSQQFFKTLQNRSYAQIDRFRNNCCEDCQSSRATKQQHTLQDSIIDEVIDIKCSEMPVNVNPVKKDRDLIKEIFEEIEEINDNNELYRG